MSAGVVEVLVRAMGGGELLRVLVEPGVYLVGSSVEAGLRVIALGVLPEHAWLAVSEFGVTLEGVREGCAVRVEGQIVEGAVLLLAGQRAQIGSAVLEVLGEPGSESSGPDENYEVGEVVARGGMGAVHRALEKSTGRTVAMKVLSEGRRGKGDHGRFVAEARLTARLEHPGVVPIYGLGTDRAGRPFYSMKLVGGATLKQILDLIAAGGREALAKHPLPVLLTVLEKVCDVVSYAHSRSWIHRDIKPENIMVGEFGEVMLMDWGVAKRVGGAERAEAVSLPEPLQKGDGAEASFSTIDGEVVGTPHFMSPEQARAENDAVDERSDVYALGAILYQMLSLRSAVEQGAVLEVLGRVGRGELRPLTEPTPPAGRHLPGGRIPSSLAAVMAKAMALRAEDRYGSATEMRDDLVRFQSGLMTGAETRGAWRNVGFFVRRHRVFFVAALVLAAVVLPASVRMVLDGRKAERALVDLRATAVALRAVAEEDVRFRHMEDALQKLETAETILPMGGQSTIRRAWIYAGLGWMEHAVGAFRRAEQEGQAEAVPTEMMPLMEKLAAVPLGEWSPVDKAALLSSMETRGFSGERQSLISQFQAAGAGLLEQVLAELERRGAGGDFFARLDDRGLVVVGNRVGRVVSSVEALKGLPITQLLIANVKATDLSPLRGMPLLRLRMTGVKAADFSFLAGMKLERLQANWAGSWDCSVLAGMPLHHLEIAGNGEVQDLAFLADAPLDGVLDIRRTQVRDIAVLKDKPLESLNISSTPVRDISFLEGSRIKSFAFAECDALATEKQVLHLTRMPDLEYVYLPFCRRVPNLLRFHPSLQRVGMESLYESIPRERFWPKYDKWLREPAASGSQGAPVAKTKEMLERDARMAEFSMQNQGKGTFPPAVQVAALWAIEKGLLNDVPVDKVHDISVKLQAFFKTPEGMNLGQIRTKADIKDKVAADLKAALTEFKQSYR